MLDKFNFGHYSNSTFCNGMHYTQLFHHYPVLENFYFDFEKNYDPIPILNFMTDLNYTVPVIAVAAYLLFIYFGRKIMENRKPFGLNNTLAAWNLLLAVFSAYGALRTVPHMVHRILTVSFEDTVCEHVFSAYGAGANGLAVVLFILSKIPELVDTVFIVLKKKPLIFLHWYHHVTVLLYCWNAYVTTSSAGLYFVSMNYTVHAVMYFYYFLQTIKQIPKWFPSWLITLMQITQMIIGTFIVGSSLYFHFYGGVNYQPGKCNNSVSNLTAGFVIYASYLYLFVEFALKRFVFGGSEKKNSSKSEKKSD